MLILFEINKTKIINCLIKKTLLLSIMKRCIMPFSIHRFFTARMAKHYEDDFKFMENK